MRIRGEQLKKISRAKQVSVEQMAEAITRSGLDGDRAVSAVHNWMRGADHPRCKAEDIQNLAGALQVQVPEIARFTSVFRNHRGSPRKVKLVVDLIRGKKVDTAINLLTFTTKRAAIDVKAALNAAIADAELASADVTSLFIAEIHVQQGTVMKRFQPKDRGRAHPIKKKMAHITVGVEEKK